MTHNPAGRPTNRAAKAGNAAVALFLLQRGCAPNAANARGETPLHWAAREGRLAALEVRACRCISQPSFGTHEEWHGRDSLARPLFSHTLTTPLHLHFIQLNERTNEHKQTNKQTLIANGAGAYARNHASRSPLDVAGERLLPSDLGVEESATDTLPPVLTSLLSPVKPLPLHGEASSGGRNGRASANPKAMMVSVSVVSVSVGSDRLLTRKPPNPFPQHDSRPAPLPRSARATMAPAPATALCPCPCRLPGRWTRRCAWRCGGASISWSRGCGRWWCTSPPRRDSGRAAAGEGREGKGRGRSGCALCCVGRWHMHILTHTRRPQPRFSRRWPPQPQRQQGGGGGG